MKNLIDLIKNRIFPTLAFAYFFIPLFFIAPQTVFGICPPTCTSDGGVGKGTTGLSNPIKSPSISALLDTILDFVIKIGLPLVTLAIIYAGFKFIKAQGKPNEISEAKQTLLYVFVGAAIILGAVVLKELIQGTVGNIQRGL